ncbi:MAG: hypothetical protein QXI19_07610 [Candidatus Caldarchaeum sp.]
MPSFKATVPFDLGRGLAKIDTDLKKIVQKHNDAFDETSGHAHSGAGEGKPIPKAGLKYAVVTVTVNAGSASGSSAADATLVGGEILGYYPAGNQDQFVDNVVLNADGSVTVTLAANAVANNTFKVIVLKA